MAKMKVIAGPDMMRVEVDGMEPMTAKIGRSHDSRAIMREAERMARRKARPSIFAALSRVFRSK